MARRMRSRLAGSGRGIMAPDITLTPLIDTVLVLLITFMVAMPVMQNMLNIELPSGSTSDDPRGKTRDRSVSVYIDREKHLYINEKPVDRTRFISDLEAQVGSGASPDKVVIVGADRHLLYEDVAAVVDDIRYLGGVQYVALATQKG